MVFQEVSVWRCVCTDAGRDHGPKAREHRGGFHADRSGRRPTRRRRPRTAICRPVGLRDACRCSQPTPPDWSLTILRGRGGRRPCRRCGRDSGGRERHFRGADGAPDSGPGRGGIG